MNSKNIYRLPFDGFIHSHEPFSAPRHAGSSLEENAVDWHLPVGTPVLAALAGRVVDAFGGGCPRGDLNLVAIDHPNNEMSFYLHLTQDIYVEEGESVESGQRIGYVGLSGSTTYPHLHFSVNSTEDRSSRRVRFYVCSEEVVVLCSDHSLEGYHKRIKSEGIKELV